MQLRPVVPLGRARIHAVTEAECVSLILRQLALGQGGSVLTMNLDHLRRLERDTSYAQCAARADIVTADGMPLIWASRLQGTPLPERVTGSNLIWRLSAAAAEQGHSVFLFGGKQAAAEETAAILCRRFPRLRIAGVASPIIDVKDWEAVERAAECLSASGADIVYVALGSPKQEELIDRLRDRMPGTWWVGVGIAFSFVSGEMPRAPEWMQRLGLEWLHRLKQEPGRLAPRYLLHGLPFAGRLLAGSAWRGWMGRPAAD